MRKFWSYEDYAAWRDEGDHSDIPVKLIGEDCRSWTERYEARIALKDAADEISSLRKRLEQAEREIGEWREAANRSHEEYYAGGFRAGIEAAANKSFLRTIVEEQSKGEWDDRMVDEDVQLFSSAIRALSPTDNTTTVAEDCRRWFHYPIIMPLTKDGMGPATVGEDAASITFEVWDEELTSHGSYEYLADAINEAMRLNALAAQKGGEWCV